MILYFVRHGIAEEYTAQQTDSDRNLTPEGVSDMKHVASCLAAFSIKPDAIIASPLARAFQTAHIIAGGMQNPSLITDRHLSSGNFSLGALQKIVSEHRHAQEMMFVGHEPDMSRLVYELCGAQVQMKKGAVACIEAPRPESGMGTLRWLMTPGILRHLKPH